MNNDLISRSALIARHCDGCAEDIIQSCKTDPLCAIMMWVVEEPAVDAVEVVRCAECIYWQDNNGGYPHEDCRWGKGETPDADDFCSYGERRADGEIC